MLRVYDAKVQYQGFFLGLNNFSNYSFNVGLGMNYYSTAAYYLLSPLNLLINFFDVNSFDIFYTIIIVLKIGLCGLTMNMFLNNIKKSKWTLLFSTSFALCGFISTYYYNVMWLDGIIMLPLIMLGIDKLVNNNKKLLYFVSLSFAIIFNFYIGYMLCIFSTIYFIFKLVNSNCDKKKAIKNFIILSLLGGFATTFVIMPSIYALLNGKASGFGSSFTNYFEINKNILTFFYHLTPANFANGDQSYGPAQIYSSILAVVLVIILFFNKDIDKRFKATTGIVILIYIASFTFNLFDFAWQLFQKPIWWQSRYSFTFSAFLITIAYISFTKLESVKINTNKKILIFLELMIFIVAAYLFKTNNNVQLVSIIFITFSGLLIIVYFYLLSVKSKIFYILLSSFLILELGLNTFYSLSQNSTSQNISDFNSYTKNINKTTTLLKEHDQTFYRSELMDNHLYNDGLMYNYNGVNYFNSVRNQRFVDFAEYQLHFNVGSRTSVIMNRFDPYILSLINIKYLIGSEIEYLNKRIDNNNLSIYEIAHPLSIGFMINGDKNLTGDYYENITNIFQSMTGLDIPIYIDRENFLVNTIIEDDKVVFEYTFDDDYLIVPAKNNIFKQYPKFYLNDEITTISTAYISVKAGDKIVLDYVLEHTKIKDNLQFKLISLDVYEKYMLSLEEGLLNLKNDSSHLLEGTITVEDKQTLFLSIPYEEGFTIKANGKKLDTFILFDTFVGVNLEKGSHSITIDYTPHGLNLGIIISSISCLISFIYIYKTKEK